MTVSAGVMLKSPYKGLSAFDDSELDALLFFGRGRETKIVAANVLASRLTVLYGPSGVGKSSLLRAGVGHELRQLARTDALAVATVSAWAGDPEAAIEDAARAAVRNALRADPGDASGTLAERLDAWTAALGGELVLLLDQLEEAFLYHPRGGALGDLLPELVMRPRLRVNVLLGIRDDALARLDAFKARVPGLFANSLRLDHLDREAARAAVLGPLERWNELASDADGVEVSIEPQLVEVVLDEVAAGRIEPSLAGRGAVVGVESSRRVETPYLQLVLQRLWEVERERGSATLRLTTFRELGGATRIVEDHLERALRTLTAPQRDMAAEMFEHLVTPSGTKIAHATGDLAAFAAIGEGDLAPVLQTLSRERILRPLGENGHAGDRWEIYHDVLGDAVLAWRARHEAERALEQERATAERRHRRLLVVAGLAIAGLAVTSTLTVYAFTQRSAARTNAADAHEQAREARARALDAGAFANLDRNPQLSLGQALAAVRMAPSAQAEDALRRSLLDARLRRVVDLGSPVRAAAKLVHGLVVATTAKGIEVVDPSSGRRQRLSSGDKAVSSPRGRLVLVIGHRRSSVLFSIGATPGKTSRLWIVPGHWLDAAFTLDGSFVVAARQDGRVDVRRVSTGALVRTIAPPEKARGIAAGPRVVAVVGAHTVYLYRASSGAPVGFYDQGSQVEAWAVRKDGRYLATGGKDGRIRVWDLQSDRGAFTFRGHAGSITSLAFSPSTRLLASASTDGTARTWWLIGRGTPASIAIGHGSYLTDVAFAPDGYTEATSSADDTVRLWKADTGARLAILAGHNGAVDGVVFLGRRRVASAGDDGTLRTWDGETEPRLSLLARLPRPAVAAAFTDRGREVTAWDAGGTQYVLDARTGAIVRTLDATAPTRLVARSPDGRTVARADGRFVLLTRAGKSPIRLEGHRGAVTSVAFSADGSKLVTAGTDREARIWDASTGKTVRTYIVQGGTVNDAEFSPDGRFLVTAGPSTAALVNLPTGRFLFYLRGHDDVVTSASFDSASRRIVTSSRDGTVRIYACQICGGVGELSALAERRLAGSRPR